jgi:hypothetical protein
MGAGRRAHTRCVPGSDSESRSTRPFLGVPPPYIRPVRRNWISRSLASVLATWLAICMAEPVQLHTCTMHGGLAVVQTASGGTHGLSSTSSTAEHGATRAGAGHSHHDQSNDSRSRQCTCLGDCNAGSSPIGIAAAGISLLRVAVTETSATEVGYDSPRVVAPEFLLPWSNGPPAGSSRA